MKTLLWKRRSTHVRDDHYPVCRLDIRQDSEFATGYGYSKTASKREPDMDKDIRNTFLDFSRIQTLEKKAAHCTIVYLVSLEASFQPSVPLLQVCLLCTGLPDWYFKAKFQKFGLFLKWFGMKKWCRKNGSININAYHIQRFDKQVP